MGCWCFSCFKMGLAMFSVALMTSRWRSQGFWNQPYQAYHHMTPATWTHLWIQLLIPWPLSVGSCEIGMAIELGGSWGIANKKWRKQQFHHIPRMFHHIPRKIQHFSIFFMGKSTISMAIFMGMVYISWDLGKFHHDRALFSLTIIIVSEGNHPKMAELFRWTWTIIIYPE